MIRNLRYLLTHEYIFERHKGSDDITLRKDRKGQPHGCPFDTKVLFYIAGAYSGNSASSRPMALIEARISFMRFSDGFFAPLIYCANKL